MPYVNNAYVNNLDCLEEDVNAFSTRSQNYN